MKIKEGFVLKELAGSHMVVPLGSRVVDFGAVIKLTETGAFLWDQLTTEKSIEELVDALVSVYDVNATTAETDIKRFVNKLKDADLLE